MSEAQQQLEKLMIKGNLHFSHSTLLLSLFSKKKDVKSSEDSLLSSIENIMTWDWDGANLVIEHCDSHGVMVCIKKDLCQLKPN